MTALDLAREYFPEWDDQTLDDIIWGETAYPFNVRRDGHEDPLRLQLAKVASRELYGEYGYFDAERSLEIAMAHYNAATDQGNTAGSPAGTEVGL